mgnify:CR=1 FL=1
MVRFVADYLNTLYMDQTLRVNYDIVFGERGRSIERCVNTDSAGNSFPLKIGHWEQFVFMNFKSEFERLKWVLIFGFMRKTIFLCHNTCRNYWVNQYSELSG